MLFGSLAVIIVILAVIIRNADLLNENRVAGTSTTSTPSMPRLETYLSTTTGLAL